MNILVTKKNAIINISISGDGGVGVHQFHIHYSTLLN